MRIILDIECDGLNPTVIHVVVIKDIDNERINVFTDKDSLRSFLDSNQVDLVVSHNGVDYDWPVLARLWDIRFPRDICRDTLVLSRLLNQQLENGHSLEAWGERLGFHKGDFDDFSRYSEEMLKYCINDVHLNHRLYLHLDKSFRYPRWEKAVLVEHEMAFICHDMKTNGFKFNGPKAEELLAEIRSIISDLDREITKEFQPRKKLIKEYTPRIRKDGSWGSRYTELFADPMVEYEDGILKKYEWEPFNPQSPKQVIDRIKDYWKPTEPTKAHKIAIKDVRSTNSGVRDSAKDKLENFKTYGWMINESNLSTIIDTEILKDWRDYCRVKILNPEKIINENTIKEIWKRKDNKQENITIEIQSIIEDVNLKEITALVSKTLTDSFLNKKDVVQFVENQKNLWSIIVTPTDMFVDCSAGFVTDTWDGLRDKDFLQKHISQIEACKLLVKRIMLGARERILISWLEHYNKNTGRIHAQFNSLGTWTHRLSHTNPNLGNVSAEKTIKYKGDELRKLAIHYGGEFRRLFTAPKDGFLVGTDMEGAHLRLFGHFIDDKNFISALVSGDKKLGTDPHSLNKKILGEICPDRDLAKTFIFTFLNGGGVGKVKEIFGTSLETARDALDGFISSYPGLVYLRESVFPDDVKRGYFKGLDGRHVPIDSTHLAMAGYLQNGEAVVMKHANVMWQKELKKLWIPFKQVNLVHDEFQTEAYKEEEAHKIGQVQSQAITQVGIDLGIKCPLAGEYKIGKDWLDSH